MAAASLSCPALSALWHQLSPCTQAISLQLQEYDHVGPGLRPCACRFYVDFLPRQFCVGRYHMMVHLAALAAQELEAHAISPVPDSAGSSAPSVGLLPYRQASPLVLHSTSASRS